MISTIDKNNRKLDVLLKSLQIYFINVLDYSFEQNTGDVNAEENTGGMNIKVVLTNPETTSLTYNTSESYSLEVEAEEKVSAIRTSIVGCLFPALK